VDGGEYGGVLGIVIVASRGNYSEPAFQVWASLAIALTGTAGGVFVYGAMRRREVHRRWSLRTRLTTRALLWWWLLVAYWIGVVLINEVRGDHFDRGAALVATALIGAGPVAVATNGVRLAADADLHRPTAEWVYDTRDLADRLRGCCLPAAPWWAWPPSHWGHRGVCPEAGLPRTLRR
jgi:hypothetical protein